MVGSFHGNDAIADFGVLFAEIFGKLCLRAGMIRISPASLTAFITCAAFFDRRHLAIKLP
jgi:hypothetical protein